MVKSKLAFASCAVIFCISAITTHLLFWWWRPLENISWITRNSINHVFCNKSNEHVVNFQSLLLAQDVIYTSHAYATMSVSVCDRSALAHYS